MTSSPAFRSMPRLSVSIASEALRTMAISSGSHPNSAASSRLTDSIRGSSTFHMWWTGISLEKRRSRIIASSTWDGVGLQPPLFKLTRVRSASKARAISDQYASSLASSAAGRDPAERGAWATIRSVSARKAGSVKPAARPDRRARLFRATGASFHPSAFRPRDQFDLQRGISRQRRDDDGRAGRLVVAHSLGIHGVEGCEVLGLREEDRGLDDVGEAEARRLQDRFEVVQDSLRRLFKSRRHQLSSLRVQRNLPGGEQEPALDDRLRVGADRLRRIVRGDELHRRRADRKSVV